MKLVGKERDPSASGGPGGRVCAVAFTTPLCVPLQEAGPTPSSCGSYPHLETMTTPGKGVGSTEVSGFPRTVTHPTHVLTELPCGLRALWTTGKENLRFSLFILWDTY